MPGAIPLHALLVAALIVTPTAHPSLLDSAAEAGREAAVRVFQSDAERRDVCLAEAERDRQLCRRAGEADCDANHERRADRCHTLYPEAPPPSARSGGGGKWLRWGLYAAGAVAVLVIVGVLVAADVMGDLTSSADPAPGPPAPDTRG